MHRVTCQIFRMGYQGFKCGSLHCNISDAAVTWPKSSHRPRLINKTGRAAVIGAFLPGVCELDRACLDNLQVEIVIAVLQVMFVTDELRRRGGRGPNGNGAKWHEGEVDARAPATLVYHIHGQNPPRNILPEPHNPPPLADHSRRSD